MISQSPSPEEILKTLEAVEFIRERATYCRDQVSHGYFYTVAWEWKPSLMIVDMFGQLMKEHREMRAFLEKCTNQDWRGNEPWESVKAKQILSSLTINI